MPICGTSRKGYGGLKRRSESISGGEGGHETSASTTPAGGAETRSGASRRRSNSASMTQAVGDRESRASTTQTSSVGPRRSSRRSNSTTVQDDANGDVGLARQRPHRTRSGSGSSGSGGSGSSGSSGSGGSGSSGSGGSGSSGGSGGGSESSGARNGGAMQLRSIPSNAAETQMGSRQPTSGATQRIGRGCGGNPVPLDYSAFKDNSAVMLELIFDNKHVMLRTALPHERRMAGLMVSHLAAGNIQAYRSMGNDDRFSITLKGYVGTPDGYVRELTETGRRFLRQFYAKTTSFHAYILGWILPRDDRHSLIDYHVDQSKDDTDAEGNPENFTNRQVLSIGMDYILQFAMLLVWYGDDGKKHQHQVATCSIPIKGDFECYCMDAVMSGRHSGYKMEWNGKTYDVVMEHRTMREAPVEAPASPSNVASASNIASGQNVEDARVDGARMIINCDYKHSSAEEALQGMEAFEKGSQDSESFADWLTNSPPLANEAMTTADVASKIKSTNGIVFEWGDSHKCRSCPNKATCCDKRPAPQGAQVETNENGVVLIPGVPVISFWKDGDEECTMCDDETPDAEPYLGVISHVTEERGNTFVDATFVYPNGTREVVAVDPDLLHPATKSAVRSLLGDRELAGILAGEHSIHCTILCDDCAREDKDLMRRRSEFLLPDMCHRCCKRDVLPGCKGCASCCGNPTCIGLPRKDGSREFHCEGIGENAEEGAPLTPGNCSRITGFICHDCVNARQRAAKAAKAEESGTAPRHGKESTAEMWRALFAATEDKNGLYVHQKGTAKGKKNNAALLGLVDGVPGIPLLMEKFGKDTTKLKNNFQANWTKSRTAKTIDFSNNCSQCKASEGGCKFVGEKITSLKLFDEYTRHHKNGGQFGTGVKRRGMKGSRFDDVDIDDE